MIEIQEYVRKDGNSPFADWFNALKGQAAAKVVTYLTRIENGNTSSLKSVGGGVHECRIHWGPGYRIYLGQEGDKLIILLCGGTKKKQQKDIDEAKEYWKEYKARKKGE
jgi:putative addiction module killer protein